MSDKRSVATDALDTLGKIIDDSAHRDAIHLAVEPCIAADILYPGQHIGIVDGKGSTLAVKKLGIVDPFLLGYVPKDGRFWLIVYPRTITSLRHVWEHPDFPEKGTISSEQMASEQWLRNFAKEADVPSYEEMMGVAITNIKDGGDTEYLHFRGEDASGVIPVEFWHHVYILTGYKHEEESPRYFSCSC